MSHPAQCGEREISSSGTAKKKAVSWTTISCNPGVTLTEVLTLVSFGGSCRHLFQSSPNLVRGICIVNTTLNKNTLMKGNPVTIRRRRSLLDCWTNILLDAPTALGNAASFLWGTSLLGSCLGSWLQPSWLGLSSELPVCGLVQSHHGCWVCCSCCGHGFKSSDNSPTYFTHSAQSIYFSNSFSLGS